jgi:signal transduction histidine kinase
MTLSCLPLLVGAYGAWHVQRSQRTASEALALNVGSMRAAEEIAIGIRDVRAHLDHFLLSGDPASLAEVPQLHREMDRWLAAAAHTAVTPREHELIAVLTRRYERFFAQLTRLARVPARARAGAVRVLIARANDILTPAQEYLDYNEEEISRSSAANQRTARRLIVGLLLLGVCGPVSGLLAGYGIAWAVHRSVVRLSVPVRDAAGKLNGVVGPLTVSGPLTATLSLEELEESLRCLADQVGAVVERLQQSQREALRAEQLAAVGQMAAGLAHELRNPLTSMKILVQSAAAGSGGLAGRDLGVLEEEITRLEALTVSLLDFARPPQPHKRPFEVRALVEDTIELLSGRAGQRDVRLECDLPATPVWLQADLGQVRQVVLNLVLNALEASADGTAVRVRLAPAPPPSRPGEAGHGVEITVEDSGSGLPADLGRDIFAPFVSTKPTGLGLGLSICKRITEAHGGRIVAADRPGGGARFAVHLPAGG